MKFARIVFALAGGLGLLALYPLYTAPGDYTYYGLLAAIASWQIVFLMIAWDPIRFRMIMIPAMLEKFIWVATLAILHARGQVTTEQLLQGIIPHGILGLLFVGAFFTTARAPSVPKMQSASV